MDTLPKQGAQPGDPTIVSVSATCSGSFMYSLLVTATDPAGASNLDTCTGDNTAAETGTFSGAGPCELPIIMPTNPDYNCTVGRTLWFQVEVTNKTGGVTTAYDIAVPNGG